VDEESQTLTPTTALASAATLNKKKNKKKKEFSYRKERHINSSRKVQEQEESRGLLHEVDDK
jgi:hypothetical protein